MPPVMCGCAALPRLTEGLSTATLRTPPMNKLTNCILKAMLLAVPGLALAQGKTSSSSAESTIWVVPTIEGLPLCDAAVKDPQLTDLTGAYAKCKELNEDGAAAVTRLLNTLEPGGARGKVQVGYTATLQLLDLYRPTPNGWKIDAARVEDYLKIVQKVDRPVVLYLSSSHFDSQGPITEELLKDPRNLMQLSDGKPLALGYFGYRIVPYTLLADESIPVNKYRFEALRYVAQKIKMLPAPVQKRIVAITLAGELHQMFPDFENGMGAYNAVAVTDYSPGSVAAFQRWLQNKYSTIAELNEKTGLKYDDFGSIRPPSKDIRKDTLTSFGEHYDAFADGTLPFSGWIWDPRRKISRLHLYVDGKFVDEVATGLNRLDVYRAEASITNANTGFRYDLDYSQIPPGRHHAQIVAETTTGQFLLAEREFVVVPRDQSSVKAARFTPIPRLKRAEMLSEVRSWLDIPKPLQDVYYNPLARDWNMFREVQVHDFLNAFYTAAVKAGLPKDKLYSHQIVPQVNSTWNPQLFAADLSMASDVPWKQGLNMYGGAADSSWMRKFLANRRITDYGVPEFNPQQWKAAGVHLNALQSHLDSGARFVSPYYFSIIPEKFKGAAEHGVNRMEIGPNNTKDGSDAFYRAIVEFARQ